MSEELDDTYKVFADLPEIGTIPPNIIPTSQRPDIVILSQTKREIKIVELSVPFEMNIETRHVQKCNKYAPLVNDIVNQGYNCQLICLEGGSRGYISKGNKTRLKTLLTKMKMGRQFRTTMHQISKLAVISSYSIFCAKDEPTWMNVSTLSIPQSLYCN